MINEEINKNYILTCDSNNIAIGTRREIILFVMQLKNSGVCGSFYTKLLKKDRFNIISNMGLRLCKVNDNYYTRRNINKAKDDILIKRQKLCNIRQGLLHLKEEEEDKNEKTYFDHIIDRLDFRLKELDSSKLKINLL